jgi:hypothetical protein
MNWHRDVCHKVYAPICKSLWIRASAKWLKCNVNVESGNTGINTLGKQATPGGGGDNNEDR